MDDLMQEIEAKLSKIPYMDKLMEINGIGLKTVSCFIAEVGDIRRFDNPKQLQKLAGYAIVADSSGKHNGESRISHRGRKRLRYALLKREWINRFKIFNYRHAYKLVFEYIETFYNTVRSHSHCGYLSPDQYEEKYYAALDEKAEALAG